MRCDSCDVAVVGGGPGGSALALSLRAQAPQLSVVVIEASRYEKPRVGETLPPPAKQVLEHLGVWDAFRGQGHREVYGTTAAWGAPDLYENEFIYSPRGAGWHVDRTRFDGMLARQAGRAGARVLRGVRVEGTEGAGGRWRLRLSDGAGLRARFVADATGRRAAFARGRGARFVAFDRLIGFARFFDGDDGHDPRTVVEAFEDGWWYTAGLPGGRRVAVCMTDVDIARRLRLREPARWFCCLGATEWVRALVGNRSPCGPPLARAAESRYLEPVVGKGWLAVGDAASIFDPLSSQGIFKAMRSGIFASYAIADLLVKEEDRGMRRYGRYVREAFEGYLRVRNRYYGEERRWPGRAFWLRRRGEEGKVEVDF